MVEGFNVTYSFTINDRELCTADFNILGSMQDSMFKDFSKFYSDNSEKYIVIIVCVDRYVSCSTL